MDLHPGCSDRTVPDSICSMDHRKYPQCIHGDSKPDRTAGIKRSDRGGNEKLFQPFACGRDQRVCAKGKEEKITVKYISIT